MLNIECLIARQSSITFFFIHPVYLIAFNRYPIRKNTTKYSKSQQTAEAEAGHFLYFDCNTFIISLYVLVFLGNY